MARRQASFLTQLYRSTNRWLEKYVWIPVLLVLAACFLFKRYDNSQLQREHRYTIGRVHAVRHPGPRSYAHATFVVQGVTYRISTPATGWADSQLVGQQFLVRYYPPEPERNAMYLAVPVSATWPLAPSAGWLHPPVSVPDSLLR